MRVADVVRDTHEEPPYTTVHVAFAGRRHVRKRQPGTGGTGVANALHQLCAVELGKVQTTADQITQGEPRSLQRTGPVLASPGVVCRVGNDRMQTLQGERDWVPCRASGSGIGYGASGLR
jgi:hypothetical protein